MLTKYYSRVNCSHPGEAVNIEACNTLLFNDFWYFNMYRYAMNTFF